MHGRHEQLSLRMAWLQRRTTARSPGQRRGGVEGETYDAPRRLKPPPPGTRPASLAEPRGDVVQVQRHIVEHLVDGRHSMVDQPVDILKIFAKLSPTVVEQVIDVPKIIQDPTPQRLEPSEPQQLVEQLVEVPVPSVLEVTIMAPFVDTVGRRWFLITGPQGYSWWLVGTDHQQGETPPGITASPGRYTNTGQG